MESKLLKDDIYLAIEELKNNKSRGIDNISAEMIKNLGVEAMKEIVTLRQ